VLDVRFWKPGDEANVRRAVATNVSRGGMFIRTSSVVPSHTRLRVEVLHAHHGFVCEGIVMRALRTPSHLQTVRPSGMGVRFLTPTELVEELLPHMAAVERPEAEPRPGEPTSAPTTGPSVDGVASSRTPGDRRGAGPAARTMELEDRVFEVVFRDRDRFRAVFERDVQTGGIFVPTDDPAAMDEVVVIRIRVEGGGAEKIEARVVHSVPPTGQDIEGGNILSGMGVQFNDVPRAVERLRALLG
jgi:Tfp pilus assembly protein PilZ